MDQATILNRTFHNFGDCSILHPFQVLNPNLPTDNVFFGYHLLDVASIRWLTTFDQFTFDGLGFMWWMQALVGYPDYEVAGELPYFRGKISLI